MNREKIGTQTCYEHQHTFVGTLMYVACLCPNLVSAIQSVDYTSNF